MSKIKLVDRLKLGLAVSIAKTVTFGVQLLRLGAASVLPGEISRRIQPNLLQLLSCQVKQGVILVAGTNGKTTTSLLLKTMLETQGWKVTHNTAGANLENGLMTALLEDTNLVGVLNADFAILEVDENILRRVLQPIKPRLIMCLNLFRDQLDRYGEVDTISKRWGEELALLPTQTVVIANADDPTLASMGSKLPQKVRYFGLNEPKQYLEEIPHAVDSIYCPKCGHLLNYAGVYLSHLGDYNCPSCNFTKPKLDIDSSQWQQILIGVYNKYNTVAAILTAQEVGVDEAIIKGSINNFKAAFGRAEVLEVEGKRVLILLSKNPVGMNETIRAVNQAGGKTKLLVLNDRTPDGTDVSWIWDVDTEPLVEKGGILVVSGDRVYDMALRLQYSQPEIESGNVQLIIEEDLKNAIATALERTPTGETLHILPTYSAMLEVREILTGRKIL